MNNQKTNFKKQTNSNNQFLRFQIKSGLIIGNWNLVIVCNLGFVSWQLDFGA